MHLVSSGRETVLTDLFDLETKATYQHSNGETVDFQFYQRQRIFVEVNKKSGLEILRIKERENQRMEIQRVRKLNIDNVYCVACATQSLEVMALGLSNGQVKLYNYKNSEFLHRFNTDNNRNSVLYLDYNASDEYISAVFESGLINVYGIKTKTKINTINIDDNSSLSRFHPTKRFQLSIASFKGAVTIYDVQSKRKLLHSPEAHAAPCRDLCMSAASPDTLISVGYDCVINIFDTRRKTQPLQLTYSHPLSSVAMSECGNYFCVGNLKGELITFDMRQTKSVLRAKKVHEGAVTRVAFVPVEVDERTSDRYTNSFGSTANHSSNSTDFVRTSFARQQRDSFCDFLDVQAAKGLERNSTRHLMRRETFDWDKLMRKPISDGANRTSLALNCVTVDSTTSSLSCNCDSFNGKSCSPETNARAICDAAALRDRSNTPKHLHKVNGHLMQIEEETHHLQLNNSDGSDKENPIGQLELSSRLSTLPPDRNSTPTHARNSTPTHARNSTPIHARKTTTNGIDGTNITPTPTTHPSITREIADLRAEMNTRFHQLESEVKFNAETNKWQIFTQSANLWNKQIDISAEIRDALAILLQTDPFVSEFLRLREENEVLKAQLQQLGK